MRKAATTAIRQFDPDKRKQHIPALAGLPVPTGQRTQRATLPINSIIPDPEQPRRHFSQEKLQELADNIKQRRKAGKEGIMSAVRVHAAEDGKHKLIYGERRWRAAMLAGETTIPADIVTGQTDNESFIDAFIENVAREDMGAMDKANSLVRIRETMRAEKLDDVATQVGLSRRRVFQLLGLLKLPEKIQEQIRRGQLKEKHGWALRLLSREPAEMDRLLDTIHKEKLSGDEAFRRAKDIRKSKRGQLKTLNIHYRTTAELKRELLRQIHELEEQESSDEAKENGDLKHDEA